MTLELVGRILVLWAGMVAVCLSNVVVDQILGVEVKGSALVQIGQNVWDVLKCVFLVWLMNMTVFGD